jgi:hypothetical protein
MGDDSLVVEERGITSASRDAVPSVLVQRGEFLNTKWLKLNDWLPTVFDGFGPDLIQSFTAQMRDDFGYISTEDLCNAKIENQLTFENLNVIVGFKIGHFNRLVKALTLTL